MLSASATPAFVWYLMQGSGYVALILLTAAVCLGVVGVTRLQSPRWPRLLTGELHRNVALIASAFVALHIGTALIDSWVGLRWMGVVVPFLSTYRPVWIGLGVVAFDLLLAIVLSSLLRKRIGTRLWRLLHWGSWILWPVALIHAFGSDSGSAHGWALGICLACLGSFGAAVTWRVRFATLPPAPRRSTSRRPVEPNRPPERAVPVG